jgi:hypothetical protein
MADIAVVTSQAAACSLFLTCFRHSWKKLPWRRAMVFPDLQAQSHKGRPIRWPSVKSQLRGSSGFANRSGGRTVSEATATAATERRPICNRTIN